MVPHGRPGKILCIGRNYPEHARELGGDVPAEPLVFLKPSTALRASGEAIVLPDGVGRVDFEGEIAFVVGRRARRVPEEKGWEYLSHVAPANDVTARDLQRADDQWTRAKGFDTFCPVGEPVPAAEANLAGLEVVTRVDGRERQRAPIRDMAFSCAEIIAFVSGIMTLEPGDLIATGTPEGVGPLTPGRVVEVEIPGVGSVSNPVISGG